MISLAAPLGQRSGDYHFNLSDLRQNDFPAITDADDKNSFCSAQSPEARYPRIVSAAMRAEAVIIRITK